VKKYLKINPLLFLLCMLLSACIDSSAAARYNHAILSSFSPSTATSAGPGFTLTVYGSYFTSGSVVLWNNSQRQTTFLSSTTLTATILSTDIAAPGTASVSVANSRYQTSPVSFAITTNTVVPVAVSVSPGTGSLQAGASQQFTASVTGSSNTGVTWSTNGGTISTAGLYVAPATAGNYSITATSSADSSKSASATMSVSVPSTGLDFYVSTTGNDANNGSAASPWRTIGHADSVAQPGWTIHVAPGTYTGSVTTNASGTVNSHIVFISDTQWGAVINQGNSGATGIAWLQNGDYTEIKGFEIGNSQYSGVGEHCSHCWVSYNKIHDIGGVCGSNGGAGITEESYSASDNHIIGNFVYNIGPNHDGSVRCNSIHGVYPAIPMVEIKNNLILKVSGDGISSWHYASQLTIINNTIIGALDAGILIGNNSSSITNSTIANNIVYNNPNCGICEEGTVGTNSYTHNHVIGNGYNWTLLNGNTHTSDVTAASPLFVNYTGDQTGNYHLSSSSPDIDTGTTMLAPSLDLAGGLRPMGVTFDIGAYELGNTPGLWPFKY